MSTAVSFPQVTLNNIAPTIAQTIDSQRCLIVSQKTASGSAVAGQRHILPRTDAEINDLCGGDSAAAWWARAFRKVNKFTNVDIICLDDDPAATRGVGKIIFTGNAVREGRYTLTVGDKNRYKFVVDVLANETPAQVASKLLARISAVPNKPFTASFNSTDGVKFTANNGGNISDDWPIIIEGTVKGMNYIITAFADGATDPSLIGLFDPVQNIRYQGVLWPAAYDTNVIKAFLDPRWNVTNNVMDGVAFQGWNLELEDIKAKALPLNSHEIVPVGNEPLDDPDWKGAGLPESVDITACYLMAMRALRFEAGVSVSDYVTTKEAADQFGGIRMASLPWFNMIMPTALPKRGAGFSGTEQRELEQSGFGVIGANPAHTGVVTGAIVTTRITDGAGNQDKGMRYLEWRDTQSVIREYQVKNLRAAFPQSRMSVGLAGPGILTAAEVKSKILLFLKILGEEALVVKGIQADDFHDENIFVIAKPEDRAFKIAEKVMIVSQAGNFIGSIEYTFNF